MVNTTKIQNIVALVTLAQHDSQFRPLHNHRFPRDCLPTSWLQIVQTRCTQLGGRAGLIQQIMRFSYCLARIKQNSDQKSDATFNSDDSACFPFYGPYVLHNMSIMFTSKQWHVPYLQSGLHICSFRSCRGYRSDHSYFRAWGRGEGDGVLARVPLAMCHFDSF